MGLESGWVTYIFIADSKHKKASLVEDLVDSWPIVVSDGGLVAKYHYATGR